MNKQREESRLKLSNHLNEEEANAMLESQENRRQFVEPKISDAIKVLKATQFFQQFSDNGNTN